MGLITCPTCNNSLSDRAASCPKCGHPISARSGNKTVSFGGLLSAFAAIIFVLFVITCGIGVVTKPTEAMLRKALLDKYGMVYGAGVVAEKLGVLNFSYQDRLVYSTLSVNIATQPEKVIAYGFLGRVSTPEIISVGNLGIEKTPTTPPVSPSIPDSGPNPQTQMPTKNNLGPEEIRNGLRTVYPMMKSEMLRSC